MASNASRTTAIQFMPGIVTPGIGGIVRAGETGFVARDTDEFVARIRQLAAQPALLQSMRLAAREYALNLSWERIFGNLYGDYRKELLNAVLVGKNAKSRTQPGVVSERIG